MTNTKDNEKDGKRKLCYEEEGVKHSAFVWRLLACPPSQPPKPKFPTSISLPQSTLCCWRHFGKRVVESSKSRSRRSRGRVFHVSSSSCVSRPQQRRPTPHHHQCPPDRRAVRRGPFMPPARNEIPLKCTTGYLPCPVTPPHTMDTAQLYAGSYKLLCY